jgi:hypothetical protein
MRNFWAKVEAKVKAAALGAFLASLVSAILNALLNGSPIPDSPHAWAQFLIITLGPPVVAFVRGFMAPHTAVAPVTTRAAKTIGTP